MKKTIMKVMALLLAVVLMLPSSLVFAATDNSQQIENAGGKHATYNNIAEDPIEISKTLTQTNNENYLDITLQVKTKENLKELYDSVAVVLVLDASNTMSDDDRVASAKEAISKFIKSYYGSGFIASEKHLGIVAFNTHAQTYAALEDYSGRTNELDSKLDSLETAIKSESYNSSHERFTNVEAGLLLANNLLKDSKMMHKFIILATDGFPTTYCYRGSHTSGEHGEIGQWTYEPSHVTDIGSKTKINGYCPYMTCNSSSCYHRASGASWGDPGYFANGFANTNNIYCRDSSCGNTNGTYADGKYHAHNRPNLKCDYGTNYSDWAAWAAESAAEYIKNQGINIYSIGIDIGGQTIHKYLESDLGNIKGVVRENEPTLYFSTMEFPSSSVDPIIGFDKDDYAKWLGENVGGSKYLDDNAYYIHYDSSKKDKEKDAQIKLMFDTISEFVTNVKNATLAKWVISDPIPEPFEFLNFINANGAKYDKNTEKITWNLKEMNVTADQNGVYTYSMSYKIRVKNEKNGFVNAQGYDTNGTTDFIWDEWNDTDKKWEERRTEFPIPSAKGYLGSLEFTKVDSEGNGLEDAVFTLKHSVNCSVCKAANNGVYIGDMTATSDSDGKVSFTKIPSGHDYVLSETVPPNGYQYDDKIAGVRNTYSVKVAYGETTVSGMTDNKVLNKKIEPAEVVFNVTKTRDENAPEDYSFKFGIFDENGNILKDENGNDYIVTVDKDNNPASFDPIIYDKWEDEFVTNGYKTDGTKTYNYKIKEILPDGVDVNKDYDNDYVYDTTVYEASVTVGVNDKRTQYTAVPSATQFSFYNEYLDPTEVQFTATKTLEGTENIPDGIFSFTLVGEGISETVQNVGNTVTFSKITYDKLGTHNYKIREIIGDNLSILYDRTVYDVEVVVKHNDNKTAYDTVVTIKEGNETVNGIAFENTLREPVDVILEARKTVNNEKPGYYQFEFELKDADGKVVSTVKNDSEGKIVFDKLTFDKAGTYNYTMSEKRFFAIGMLFDMKVYDVEIAVTADSTDDDPFEATVTVSRKGKVLEDWPVFRNITNGRSEENEDYNPSTGATVITAASVAAVTAGGIVLVKFIRNKKRK